MCDNIFHSKRIFNCILLFRFINLFSFSFFRRVFLFFYFKRNLEVYVCVCILLKKKNQQTNKIFLHWSASPFFFTTPCIIIMYLHMCGTSLIFARHFRRRWRDEIATFERLVGVGERFRTGFIKVILTKRRVYDTFVSRFSSFFFFPNFARFFQRIFGSLSKAKLINNMIIIFLLMKKLRWISCYEIDESFNDLSFAY